MDTYEKKIREYLNNDEVDELYKNMLLNLFPELAESEDERIRKVLIKAFEDMCWETWRGIKREKILNWLEKQGKNNMGISEATKQKLEDNLNKALEKETPKSWNEFLEKQGEQKPYGQRQECVDCQFNYAGECKGFCAMKRDEQTSDKVEPKFKVGDTVTVKPMSCHGKVFKGEPFKIVDIIEDNYVSDDGKTYSISLQDGWELVEYKPTDKIESKFKVGDWVVTSYGKVNQVISVDKDDDGYTLDDDVYFSGSWCDMYHLWTIQDAKDGDVLAEEAIEESYQYPFVAIYKNHGSNIFYSYCYIGFDGKFYKAGTLHPTEKIYPATKEQRDLLFQKMHEAGYEWDAEKKELKKIEQKPADKVEPDILIEESYQQQADDLIDMVTENPAWSEEDEKMYTATIFAFAGFMGNEDKIDWLKSLKDRVLSQPKQGKEKYTIYNPEDLVLVRAKDYKSTDKIWSEEDDDCLDLAIIACSTCHNNPRTVNWLKSLKDRVQPKQKWSEEDRRMLIGLIDELDAIMNKATSNEISVYSKYINWLKSLRPQNTWKPSSFHLECISDAIAMYQERGINAIGLKEILEELKKLREE